MYVPNISFFLQNIIAFFPAYVESTFVFITVVLMGKEHKEQVTAGLYMFNAFADICNGPASGKYNIILSTQIIINSYIYHFFIY